MDVLLISSEPLHPADTYSSTFELAQAAALQQSGVDVTIASVYLLSVRSLLVSIVFTLLGRSKVNTNARRFTVVQMMRLLLYGILKKKARKVHFYTINGITVVEAIGFKLHKATTIKAVLPYWIAAGRKAYEQLTAAKKIDLVHAHSRFLYAPALASELKQSFGVAYVVTEHSSRILSNSITPHQKQLLQTCYKDAAAVIAVSHAVKQKLQALTGIAAVEVVPNILDTLFLKPAAKKPHDRFTIISVGRMDDNKNQALLLEAIAMLKHKDVSVVLAGIGPNEKALLAKATALGVSDKILFKGHLNKEEIRNELLAADVLVITSKVETFGVVAIEAMACGLPVISTRCGGPEDIITADNGLLIEPTADSLAQALETVRSNTQRFDAARIRNGCLKKFAGSVVAAQLKQIYTSVCTTAAGKRSFTDEFDLYL